MPEKTEIPCVRCGTCKAICPSRKINLIEPFSPRGWMVLFDEYKNRTLEPSKRLVELIYSCLLCDACRDKCPSGVDIKGNIILMRRMLRKHLYGRIFMAKMALEVFSQSGRLGDLILGYSGFLKRFFIELTLNKKIKTSSETVKDGIYETMGKRLGRLFFFMGCLVKYFLPHLGMSLIRFLNKSGFDVIVSHDERCCGSPYEAMGLHERELKLKRSNEDMFSRFDTREIITLCPTCALMLKGGNLNVLTLNEFIVENYHRFGFTGVRDSEFALHEPCHLRYTLGLDAHSYGEILKEVGYNVRYMEGGCCGFAGLYAFINKESADVISDNLKKNYIESGIKKVVTSCPMCILSLEDKEFDVKHMVEVL